MAVDERSRHQLYLKLEEVLGPEEATVLMEYLPPVGWADVATKRDLDAHAVATKRELDALAAALNDMREQMVTKVELERFGHELTATFRGELLAQTRIMVFALVSAVLTMGGLVFAARLV